MTTYLTKRELALQLKCSVRSIERAMQQGLPYYRLGGLVRFIEAEVDEWRVGKRLVRHNVPAAETSRQDLSNGKDLSEVTGIGEAEEKINRNFLLLSNQPPMDTYREICSGDSVLLLSAKDVLRFWSRVNKTESCWIWAGNLSRNGYGHFCTSIKRKTKNLLAHRVAYQIVTGPIPAGLQLDHLCRNRACVNPGHLEAVDHRTNMLRSPIAPGSIHAHKTHCINGHEFDAGNTYLRPKGGRDCRRCRYMAGVRRNQSRIGVAS